MDEPDGQPPKKFLYGLRDLPDDSWEMFGQVNSCSTTIIVIAIPMIALSLDHRIVNTSCRDRFFNASQSKGDKVQAVAS